METEGDKETSRSTKAGTELITMTGTSSNAEKSLEKPKQDDIKELAAAAEVETSGGKVVAAAGEGKAAKIERLKSGFRLCRPQGTFLWPNMVMKTTTTTTNTSCTTSSSVVEVVPTPPSVNSSSYRRHLNHQQLARSPVKPVPERRPLTMITHVSEPHPTALNDDDDNMNKITTTALINLNDIPTNASSSTSQQKQTSTAHLEVMKSELATAAAYGYMKSHEQKRIMITSSSSSCFSNTSPPIHQLGYHLITLPNNGSNAS